MNKEEILLKELKDNIGFKTAFKATLGFYAAQLLVQTIGLSILAGIIFVLYSLGR